MNQKIFNHHQKNYFMAKILDGLFGNISGTVGEFEFFNRNGITYVRSRRRRPKYKPTKMQLAQTAKFSVVSKFINSMNSLLRFTFKEQKGKNARSRAFSHAMKNSVTGNYPAFKLDYSKTLLSSGKLPNADNPIASAGAPGEIKFTWTDNSGHGLASARDKAILVAYCEELNASCYEIAGPNRRSESGSLINPEFCGKKVHTWIAFSSATCKSVSVYTGSVNVAGSSIVPRNKSHWISPIGLLHNKIFHRRPKIDGNSSKHKST